MNHVTLSLIVAYDRSGCIGKEGKLPWRMRDDLKWFKEKTMGKVLIMGNETYKSLPNKELPGRKIIVMTRSPLNGELAMKPHADKEVWYANTRGAALTLAMTLAKRSDNQEAVVCGGEQIYKLFLDDVEKLYTTVIDTTTQGGDAYFPLEATGGLWVEDVRPISPNEHNEFGAVAYTLNTRDPLVDYDVSIPEQDFDKENCPECGQNPCAEGCLDKQARDGDMPRCSSCGTWPHHATCPELSDRDGIIGSCEECGHNPHRPDCTKGKAYLDNLKRWQDDKAKTALAMLKEAGYNPELVDLLPVMQMKYSRSRHKYCPDTNPRSTIRDHSSMPIEWFLDRGGSEMMELEEAVEQGDYQAAILEFADVACFMAYGAAKARKLSDEE